MAASRKPQTANRRSVSPGGYLCEIVLEKRNTTYSGYKTVDAAKLQGAAGGTGKVQAEPAKK